METTLLGMVEKNAAVLPHMETRSRARKLFIVDVIDATWLNFLSLTWGWPMRFDFKIWLPGPHF